jgi:hypothetical protein
MKGQSHSKFSDAAREQIRTSATAQGERRHDAVVAAVTQAMRTIEQEIQANQGLYPGNGGALTLNELVRRAYIGPKTLFGAKFKDGFKKEVVDPWLVSSKGVPASSRREAKKSAAQRVSEWRDLYDDLLTAYRVSELDGHEARRVRKEAEEMIQQLKDENKELRQKLNQVTKGNVTALPRK